MNVSVGKVVSVDYTLRIDEEDIVDTNVGAEPLIYQHGAQELLPGLEQGLEGMAAGVSKRIVVIPAEGHSDVYPEGFFEIAKKRIAPEALRVGAKLQGEAPDGTSVFPRVAEIREETVNLDLIHPLAGKIRFFDVKVLDSRQSS